MVDCKEKIILGYSPGISGLTTKLKLNIGVGDGSAVEPTPRDSQVLRGGGFESHRVLLLGPHATGVPRPA